MRERTKEREGSWNTGESGQLVLLFCSVIDVTYIVAGVYDMQVRDFDSRLI